MILKNNMAFDISNLEEKDFENSVCISTVALGLSERARSQYPKTPEKSQPKRIRKTLK